MITKKQFCKLQIEKWCNDHDVPIDKLTEQMAYESSTLGVCMEYLGLVKSKEAKEYVNSRGGTMFIYGNPNTKEVAILSTREFINLLPENL